MATNGRLTAHRIPAAPNRAASLATLLLFGIPQMAATMELFAMSWVDDTMRFWLAVAVMVLGMGHLLAAFLGAWRRSGGVATCWVTGAVGTGMVLFGMMRILMLSMGGLTLTAWSPGMWLVVVVLVADLALCRVRLRTCASL